MQRELGRRRVIGKKTMFFNRVMLSDIQLVEAKELQGLQWIKKVNHFSLMCQYCWKEPFRKV